MSDVMQAWVLVAGYCKSPRCGAGPVLDMNRQWVNKVVALRARPGPASIMSEIGNKRNGVGFALLAAALFGLSTPLAKCVSPHVEPVLLAGLLYLGSGIGLGAYSLLRLVRQQAVTREAAMTRADAPWLAGAILTGGVVGPLLLMWGLVKTPASSASLLLNL